MDKHSGMTLVIPRQHKATSVQDFKVLNSVLHPLVIQLAGHPHRASVLAGLLWCCVRLAVATLWARKGHCQLASQGIPVLVAHRLRCTDLSSVLGHSKTGIFHFGTV